MRDIIYALATAPGRAAIAVVRVSGPGAADVLHSLSRRRPRPRQASLVRLRDPVSGEVLDQALAIRFDAPASYTGEDLVELHLHGGLGVVEAVLRTLRAHGLRLAEPGEFTRRAFEGGRMDLAEAEAVADLVDAETDQQRRQALVQLEGGLSRRHERWRSELLEAAALLEAAIDFPDEALPGGLAEQAQAPIVRLRQEFAAALADTRGERIRDGYRIALIGPPNAGKSSLLNALARRDAAIVTEVAGTTRDVIEVPLVVEGYKVVMADTAGLRQTAEVIEREGVRRARAWAEAADLRVLVIDRADPGRHWTDAAQLCCERDLLVLNKMDAVAGADEADVRAWAVRHGLLVLRSSVSHGQTDGVSTALRRRVVSDLAGQEPAIATRTRHFDRIGEATAYLERALDTMDRPELAAEDVRLAAQALERLSGRVDVEDVLTQVFETFCIGK